MNKKLIDWWSGASYDSDYQAWLTQIVADGGTQPSASVKTAQNALVVALKANSLWTRIKTLYFLHCGDITTGRRNVKNPSTYRTTPSGSNIFLEGSGIKSDGTSYILLNYLVQEYSGIETDITVGMFISTSSTSSTNQAPYGSRIAGATDIWFMYPRESGTNVIKRRHFGSTSFAATNANHRGVYIHTYDGSNDVIYKDGTKTSNADTPVVPTANASLTLLGRNTAATGPAVVTDFYTTGYVSYFFTLNRVNDSDESAIRSILNSYNTTIGL